MSRTKLKDVVAVLEGIAPLHLAEEWDNVGLLVEPKANASVKKAILTIDLGQTVFQECLDRGCDFIISYHPPIFTGFKRLLQKTPHQQVILAAIRKGIAVYSPHTALDAAIGGVNDWLISGLGTKDIVAIDKRAEFPGGMDTKIVVFVPDTHVESVRQSLVELGCGRIGDYSSCSFELEGQGTFRGGENSMPRIGQSGQLERVDEVRLEMVCRQEDLASVARVIEACHPYEEAAWDAFSLRPRPKSGLGQGRMGRLPRPISLSTVVKRIKQHLTLDHIRVARPDGGGATIETVAVCAGAGASVVLGQNVDLIVTGEMRHHDVLACVENGQTVILCDHTNTERGFLKTYAERLNSSLASVEFVVAQTDHDPLTIV